MFKIAIVRASLFLSLAMPAFAQVGLNVDVETVVRAKFADTPVMIDIARCESKFRQYTDTGNPLYGGYQGKMIGVFQVFEDIHADYAKSIGMDIYTLDGNLAYALFLYNNEGTKPWLSSMPCWGKDPDREASPSNGAGINADTESAPTDSLTQSIDGHGASSNTFIAKNAER